MASLPIWLEGILDRKYPKWRDVEHHADGSARTMPAWARVLEASLLRVYAPDDVVCSYPADLHRFVGPRTRVVGVSTHNPLGVTFAAGVYTSILGSSREPINQHAARAPEQSLYGLVPDECPPSRGDGSTARGRRPRDGGLRDARRLCARGSRGPRDCDRHRDVRHHWARPRAAGTLSVVSPAVEQLTGVKPTSVADFLAAHADTIRGRRG